MTILAIEENAGAFTICTNYGNFAVADLVGGELTEADVREANKMTGDSIPADYVPRPKKYVEEVRKVPVMETVQEQYTTVEIVDGAAIQTVGMRTVERQAYDEYPLFDAVGAPIMEEVAGVMVQKVIRKLRFVEETVAVEVAE